MKFRYYLCILPLLASCTAQPLVDGNEIMLTGVVSGSYDTKSAIRAQAYKETVPSTDAPLSADIWFSTTSGLFQNTGGLNSHKTITYYGPSVTNPSPDSEGYFIHYPTDGTKVYCVGFYPQGRWTTTDGTTATATIDGEKDLMFASQLVGNNKSPLSATPQLYKHQLTWVKIRVRTFEHEAVETWGHMKKISIASAKKATANLGSGEVSYSDSTEFITFEGDEEIPIKSWEYGSILVSPAPADEEGIRYYNVSIECENHSRKNLKVKIKDYNGDYYKDNTAGTAIILNLYFQTLKSISYTTTLESWEDEGRSLELE